MYPKEPGPVTAEPLVSVAVINHNYSQYVCEAIDSVLNQTYRNIEVLVVDDGSTDGRWTLSGTHMEIPSNSSPRRIWVLSPHATRYLG